MHTTNLQLAKTHIQSDLILLHVYAHLDVSYTKNELHRFYPSQLIGLTIITIVM